MMAQAFNLSTQGRQKWVFHSLYITGQPGIPNKFHDSQGCIIKETSLIHLKNIIKHADKKH